MRRVSRTTIGCVLGAVPKGERLANQAQSKIVLRAALTCVEVEDNVPRGSVIETLIK
jgi:hypothetical protein